MVFTSMSLLLTETKPAYTCDEGCRERWRVEQSDLDTQRLQKKYLDRKKDQHVTQRKHVPKQMKLRVINLMTYCRTKISQIKVRLKFMWSDLSTYSKQGTVATCV